jgi:hypothetical protein
VFGLGALSVASLLLYFYGVGRFVRVSVVLLSLETAGLIGLTWFARRRGWTDVTRLMSRGLWAGCMATLVYDAVRVPIAHMGVPVFKAISYFGTVLLGIDHPTARTASASL